MQLIVIVKRLNKRTAVPGNLPEPSNIIGVVLEGFRFEGTEVDISEIINPNLGKWYKDRDGHYYWGGGVMVEDDAIPQPPVAMAKGLEEVAIAIPWWLTSLGIAEIWNKFNEKGANAKIAVIDSGYNVNNPEIATGVVGTYLHPSLVGKTTINDNFGHGSYCASIIGARNSNIIIGCAPQSHLYISKISNGGSFDKIKMTDAIEDAIKNEVDVISISNGGIEFDQMRISIQKAIAKNIVIVAAIGNNIDPNNPQQGGDFPALFNECIAVGSTDKSKKLSLVTLINGKTEINAPGEDISGYIKNNFPEKFETSTSAATAVVAGICGLIISRHKKTGKPYTSDSIKKLITNFSDPVVGNSTQKLISPMKIFNNI